VVVVVPVTVEGGGSLEVVDVVPWAPAVPAIPKAAAAPSNPQATSSPTARV
jgi:hypothetical protein